MIMSNRRIYSTYNKLVDVEFYQVLKGWFDVNTIALVVAAFGPYIKTVKLKGNIGLVLTACDADYWDLVEGVTKKTETR